MTAIGSGTTYSIRPGTGTASRQHRSSPTGRPDVHEAVPARGDSDDSNAHLLRLCLDLQLDAMMLTLGAAARQPLPAPWRRWLDEDVDLACALATDARSGKAALPSVLGTNDDRPAPSTIDTLIALYETMRARLCALAGERPGALDWEPRVELALHRCETRLTELREHRLGPPRTQGGRGEHCYLPGELLG